MVDKIAIVTGGSMGLGREVARELLGHGYRVAIFGRSQASLDAAVADLNATPGNLLAVPVDVADENSIAAGFARVDAELGPAGTLVNNAALFAPFAIEDASADQVEPLVQTNLCGPIYCMRQAVKRMRTIGGGDIVNVSSESTRRPSPYFTVYTATKAALEAMTTMMGEELREEGIRAMIFRVGRMNSHGAQNQEIPEHLLQRFLNAVQVGGAGYWTGAGMEPASAAQALVRQLLTNRDARVELVEVRSA